MFQLDANVQLAQQYGLPSIRESIDFANCDPMVKFNIQQVEASILAGLSSSVLRMDQLRGKILDFGCGRGVSTSVFNAYGADVVGVELNSTLVAEGVKLGFLPAEKLKSGDGIAYLKSLPAGSLDLVNASMLGPDMDGNLSRNFLQACMHALKPGGTILITSDAGTLMTLDRVNPLGNGFLTQGVFIAIRGRDSQNQFDTLPHKKAVLGLPVGGDRTFEDLDFEFLLAKFRFGDNK